jgi:DNA-binding PadR family transcriptional regulator
LDVKTICLGVLTLGEATGYEIKKQFEMAFRHFFAAGFGSIYPALNELTGEGLLTCREVRQVGRPDKKVYRITEAGRHTFQRALAATPPRHKVRSEFLALTFFADALPRERLDEVLEERAADLERQLAYLDGLDGEALPPGPAFTLGMGRAAIGAMRDYLAENGGALLEELERGGVGRESA